MANIINKLRINNEDIRFSTDAVVGLQDKMKSTANQINSIQENLFESFKKIESLRLNIDIQKEFIEEHKESIISLNQKTQLLFTQINNTNKIISAYVKEQLFNLERVRLECKRENLAHIIEEEVMEKRIIWIIALPWYKKITKKQQIKLITKMQLIRDEVEAKYKTKMDEVILEIKNHTRENFFAELNRVTNGLREKK